MAQRKRTITVSLTDVEASRVYDVLSVAIGRDTDTGHERLARFSTLIDGWLADGDKHGAIPALRSAYNELGDAMDEADPNEHDHRPGAVCIVCPDGSGRYL
jgi:hypothetical protein